MALHPKSVPVVQFDWTECFSASVLPLARQGLISNGGVSEIEREATSVSDESTVPGGCCGGGASEGGGREKEREGERRKAVGRELRRELGAARQSVPWSSQCPACVAAAMALSGRASFSLCSSRTCSRNW